MEEELQTTVLARFEWTYKLNRGLGARCAEILTIERQINDNKRVMGSYIRGGWAER
jgi:hypothetical protein